MKFLSLEPLLGPLPNLNLKGIDWVIAGGQSGPGARHMKEEWVKELRKSGTMRCGKSSVFLQTMGRREREKDRSRAWRIVEQRCFCPAVVGAVGVGNHLLWRDGDPPCAQAECFPQQTSGVRKGRSRGKLRMRVVLAFKLKILFLLHPNAMTYYTRHV